MIKKFKVDGEITNEDFGNLVEELVKYMNEHKPEHLIYIFGYGCQTRNFYTELKREESVRVSWSGWSGPKLLCFLSFIPGQAGLSMVLDKEQTKKLYYQIGNLSYCGLYYLPKDIGIKLEKTVRSDYWDFMRNDRLNEILSESEDYFVLENDFDFHGGEKDGEITWHCIDYGKKTEERLKNIAKIGTTKNET